MKNWLIKYEWNSEKLFTEIRNAWTRNQNIALFNPALKNFGDFPSLAANALKKLDQIQSWRLRPKIVLCTSGSTGSPKLVCLEKEAAVFNAKTLVRHLGMDSGEKWTILGAVPLFHAFGLNLCAVNSFENDYSYTHIQKGDLIGLQKAMEEARARKENVFLPLVPQTAQALTSSILSQAEGVSVVGGDVLSLCTLNALQEKLPNFKHTIGYGMTEAGPAITHTRKNQSLDACGLIGRALPGIKTKVDQTLWFKSPGQALAVYEDGAWRETKGKWMDTGDIVIENNGEYCFRGRKKNVLKINSEMVFPEEIITKLKEKIPNAPSMYLEECRNSLSLKVIGEPNQHLEKRLWELVRELPSIYRPASVVFIFEETLNALGKTAPLRRGA